MNGAFLPYLWRCAGHDDNSAYCVYSGYGLASLIACVGCYGVNGTCESLRVIAGLWLCVICAVRVCKKDTEQLAFLFTHSYLSLINEENNALAGEALSAIWQPEKLLALTLTQREKGAMKMCRTSLYWVIVLWVGWLLLLF